MAWLDDRTAINRCDIVGHTQYHLISLFRTRRAGSSRPMVETCGNGDTLFDIGRKNSLIKPKDWRAGLNEAFAPEPFNRHKPLRRIVGFKRYPPVSVCCR